MAEQVLEEEARRSIVSIPDSIGIVLKRGSDITAQVIQTNLGRTLEVTRAAGANITTARVMVPQGPPPDGWIEAVADTLIETWGRVDRGCL
jgi:hypothetical protein